MVNLIRNEGETNHVQRVFACAAGFDIFIYFSPWPMVLLAIQLASVNARSCALPRCAAAAVFVCYQAGTSRSLSFCPRDGLAAQLTGKEITAAIAAASSIARPIDFPHAL